ncbi:hypothetical protein [Nocardia sp. NPDC052112]|uniref:hypothetical protein n=1 Tax=Nocardia sp. NPDC052112 TaxID=3155646 RepID=UPI003446E607
MTSYISQQCLSQMSETNPRAQLFVDGGAAYAFLMYRDIQDGRYDRIPAPPGKDDLVLHVEKGLRVTLFSEPVFSGAKTVVAADQGRRVRQLVDRAVVKSAIVESV